jgi:uncharacterized membrane protein
MNYLPLLSTIVAFIFTIYQIRQYVHRKRTHQLLWIIALFFYGVATLIEFLMNPDLLGASPFLFQIYYVLAASLVGLLAAGVIFLLLGSRLGRYFLTFVVIVALGLILMSSLTPIDAAVLRESFSGELADAFQTASHAYPFSVRIFSIILNSVGGTILIGGAILSYLRDRSRTYNLFLVIGALLPMMGGYLIGIIGSSDVFFEFELGGIVFLFVGFLLSDRYIKAREINSPNL